MKKTLNISLLITCVLLGAVADGLNMGTSKEWGHILEAVEVLALFSIGFIYRKQFFVLLISYICLRIALFDYVHNIASGQDLLFVGTATAWDRVLSNFPSHGIMFAKAIFLIAGIAVPIKELR